MSAAAHHYHYGDGRASSAEMYLHRLSGQEKEPHIVSVDHSYAKAWNAHPDSHHAKPAKLLFMKDVFVSEGRSGGENVLVNVEAWKGARTRPYDGSKTRNLMSECERSASLSCRPDASWDCAVKRLGWTGSQQRLFNQVMRLLHADRLARLAYCDNANEPVLRRLAVDRTARRLRRIVASWDLKLLQWLHQVLMEKAGVSYVAAYLDALQALRAHLPHLVDRLVGHSMGSVLLRRPWDPVAPFLSQHKPKRLPCAPLLLVCSGGPRPQVPGLPKFWSSQLSVLGKLVTVEPTIAAGPGATLNQVLEATVAAARAKVLELRSSFSSRPIVLVGWMVGGLVACQVSLFESVAAVVCFGFPLVGLGGPRDVDDPVLDSHTPTLFVVGQNALSCSMDELENFREHMKAVSGLVVVGGADDALHMCALKKRLEGVTQSMVDRCILDEVGAFLQWVLSAPLMGPAGSMATTARRCSPEVARRQGRPFYHPGSSLNVEPGLKSSIVATKRGSGRRIGRPPKQIIEKSMFSTFAASLKVPLHGKRAPSLQSDPPPDVPLSQSSEVDLMPTSSLWSQSLIADPQSSPCSSPMSSPLSRFQHKDLSNTILPDEANPATKEEGKFVSLADGGVRTSQLEKPLSQATTTQAACQMVLPASGTISMVVTPTKMELLSGHSASEATMQTSSALEMLAEASSNHSDTVQVGIRQKASLPSTAATRTRKVRMPRFYDS
ncbi:reduction in Cnn dots 1 [Rhipicephalus microplus]|uniref:reduction in Cnn dots 1 n=1 Tax=Rhipicephalus microplus TaxID=6941 RepID=UPI003F6AF887